jgi:hypothetical protein
MTLYSSRSMSTAVSENKLKAAYIHRFIPYIKHENTKKIKTILFQNASENTIEIQKNLIKISKDKYQVRELNLATPNSVIYLSCERVLAPQELIDYQSESILLISSCEDATSYGVMINFVQIKGKLKFKINNTSAIKAKLKISSQLLKLALEVK